MRDRTRKGIVFSALVLAILLAIYSFWPSITEKSEPAADRTPERTFHEQPAPNSEGVSPVDVDAKEGLPWGQSPFHRRRTSAVAASEYMPWVLSGIIYNEREPMAIINKRTLRTGDIINRARIKRIDRSTVVLEYNGNEFTLRVSKG
jgi:type II secretory pathway component PulC